MSTSETGGVAVSVSVLRALFGDEAVDAQLESDAVESLVVAASLPDLHESPREVAAMRRDPGRPRRPRGRDQERAMERLLVLTQVFALMPGRIVGADELVRAARYTGTPSSQMASLARDLKRLDAAGWHVENVAPRNARGRYRVRRDSLDHAVSLSPAERAALDEAFRDDAVLLGEQPRYVSELSFARAHRCAVTLAYGGHERTVDPVALQSDHGGWRLRGRDRADGLLKWFALQRITWLELSDPGTAESVEDDEGDSSLNPHSWHLDPPVDVRLATDHEHLVIIENKLGTLRRVSASDDGVEVEVHVTNRGALTAALLELGTRVRLIGPPEVKADFVAMLEAVL